MARTRLQDTALRARDLEQRNHELHAALRVAKHAVLNAPRSPTMIHFEALQKSVSSMEGRHKERERELERMLRGLEDRRDAEMHALKRKVRHATVCLHCVCIRVCIRVLFMYINGMCIVCVVFPVLPFFFKCTHSPPPLQPHPLLRLPSSPHCLTASRCAVRVKVVGEECRDPTVPYRTEKHGRGDGRTGRPHPSHAELRRLRLFV